MRGGHDEDPAADGENEGDTWRGRDGMADDGELRRVRHELDRLVEQRYERGLSMEEDARYAELGAREAELLGIRPRHGPRLSNAGADGTALQRMPAPPMTTRSS